MSSNSDRYAFIGLGAMGLPMAINLQTHFSSSNLPPLIVYNRTFSKTQSVKEIGAIAATNLKQAIENANIIFTSLANDDAVNQVYDQLLKELELINDNNKKKRIFIETSTIHPATISALREKVEKANNTFLLHCPVWGSSKVAKDAQLSIITSGNQGAIDYILPLLVPVLGKQTLPAGDDVKKAAKYKLMGNYFVLGTIELLSEGITFAEKSGLEKEMVLEYISSVYSPSIYLHYGTKMIEESFDKDVGFNVTNGLKDIGHIQQLAKDSGTHVPIADLMNKHLNYSKDYEPGADNYDWSCMIGSLRVASGLPFMNKNVKKE
ncbi:NAD binding domain of 6-phosphogluconate dehydrogenase-domain-containing protein [Gigaspora margarita]|uniref:NAD binding domain of 6-phosphogluconate dehydrogenase-domain-containing protein n=1 Tax=Gigaspora margarita TaxID=4874 RepID=A0A8H4A2B8_GIGMA|nr:NAD binding domain of 6-phosphogluconate dehydrogenase-domain-containing protein [Gigaspora margarita]